VGSQDRVILPFILLSIWQSCSTVEIHTAFAYLVIRLVTSCQRQIVISIKKALNNEPDYLTILKTTCLCTHNWTHIALRHKSLKMICP
jgi:hypothetical protein